jgi:hypothetical protein
MYRCGPVLFAGIGQRRQSFFVLFLMRQDFCFMMPKAINPVEVFTSVERGTA